MRASTCCTLLGVALSIPAGSAFAQSYPARPVRVIVGFPAASGVDIATRLVTAKLTESLGGQFIVDNRPGAAGNIAVELAARAAPDGYTLASVTAAAAVSQSALAKPPFDLIKDLASVGMVCSVPFVLGIHPSIPAKSLPELVALAKAKPGQLAYGTPGLGSTPHVAFELLKMMAGIDILHVPYKGTPQAIADALAGNVSMALANPLTMLPQVKAGRLRAIAITSAKRSSVAPDVPTFAESGVPDYQSGSWYSFMAPAATPRNVVSSLNGAIVRVVQLPDVREKLHAQGAEPVVMTAEQMNEFVRNEVARVAKVVKATGLRLD